MTIAAIRDSVLEDCRRSENVFGPCFFEEHLAVVARYGNSLAEQLGANPEIVELAAYLHDLSAVRDPATIQDHANLSARIASRLLSERGYPSAIVESVARCIVSHSTPVQIGSGPPEEICVSNADAIAQIVRPGYWLYVVFGVRKLGFEEGRQWLLGRLENNWNGLVKPARELVSDRYRLARQLLDSGYGVVR